MKVQIGDEVRIQRSTARARGEIVSVGDAGAIVVKGASGKLTKWNAAHVVEVVKKSVVPPATVAVNAAGTAVAKGDGVRSGSMLGLALGVLNGAPAGMHVKALTDAVLALGFKTTGKTPQATMAAVLLVAERKGLVTKVAPATFALKAVSA